MGKLSWEPVRNGAIYCSPACGGRCTFAAYEAALKGASELAERMGLGWTPRVWENLGWHYTVEHSGASISQSVAAGQFLCIINTPAGSASAHADSPEKAYADAFEEIRDRFTRAAQAFGVLPLPAGK